MKTVEDLHEELESISYLKPPRAGDLTTEAVREYITSVASARVDVAKVLSLAITNSARIKKLLVEANHRLDSKSNAIINNGSGLLGATNEAKRKARIAYASRDILDEIAKLEAEQVDIEGLKEHARLSMSILDSSFDAVSRCLSTIELDRKINHVS